MQKQKGGILNLVVYLEGCLFSCSYQQALSAVELGKRKLEELDIPTTRPDDYFAEMVKTDDHMRKVRVRGAPTLDY